MTDSVAAEIAIRDAVVEAFLEAGKALDASEIARRLGWSVSKVRRVMGDNGGCVRGLQTYQDHRPSESRNYPGMVTGSHKVWLYKPSLEALRALVLELRAARG
jgi:hypothetical protein